MGRQKYKQWLHRMCRLYGFRATAPTKVECTLVHAQNALMVQSRQDMAGLSNDHGWGVATYEDHFPHVAKMAWAAYQGEQFRRAAARVHSRCVMAHVRRATIGPPTLVNTHPFTHAEWTFAHNGTVPSFDHVRPNMLDAMASEHRAAIAGVTDSEHVFRLIMSLYDRDPSRPLLETLSESVQRVVDMCLEASPQAKIGLNTILTDGERLVGTRLGRTLYYIERDGIYDCEVCGYPHARQDPQRAYRAVVVASEPISQEVWHEMPERSVYAVTPEMGLHIESLD